MQLQPTTDSPRLADVVAQGSTRALVEFIVVLVLSILTFRTFAAEAYIVPTGSMAPTLLGMHRVVPCANCKMPFAVGMDEEGRSGRAVCPNCGHDSLDQGVSLECSGDRLLVQKYLYDLRDPRRWEVAVFQSPEEQNQAYVKRVVGLPGESVQILGGDLYIDGKIARKSLAQQHAMRIPVHDSTYFPADANRFPRWVFHKARPNGPRNAASGWTVDQNRFVHRDLGDSGEGTIDWLDYRHWQPDRIRYGPINDFSPYNGGDLRGENSVGDLSMEVDVALKPEARSLSIRIGRDGDRFYISLPVDGRRPAEVRRNGLIVPLLNLRGSLTSSPDSSVVSRVEASLMDRRLIVAVDGTPLFDPIDFEMTEDPIGGSLFASPVGLGLEGSGAEVSAIRLYRDVFYTAALAGATRKAFGVDRPYQLKEGEFFVLGDNSAVSNDSRFWKLSPVVRAEMFLGKPFLVHLPGQVMPLKVFGRSVYWVPDPREIRYIR
ncbi:signal peptidase I [Isosphaeraceae bacterium EP7]